MTHGIHVWDIYPHLVEFGKCRKIHPYMDSLGEAAHGPLASWYVLIQKRTSHKQSFQTLVTARTHTHTSHQHRHVVQHTRTLSTSSLTILRFLVKSCFLDPYVVIETHTGHVGLHIFIHPKQIFSDSMSLITSAKLISLLETWGIGTHYIVPSSKLTWLAGNPSLFQ